MKKLLTTLAFVGGLIAGGNVAADQAKGLNVIVTSSDRQAQMMAMVLSLQTVANHGKEVNMVLCASAGDLALAETVTEPFAPPQKSPTMLLKRLIGLGANVQVCPLYLPSVGKSETALLDGISVAKPPVVAGKLLDTDYRILSF